MYPNLQKKKKVNKKKLKIKKLIKKKMDRKKFILSHFSPNMAVDFNKR